MQILTWVGVIVLGLAAAYATAFAFGAWRWSGDTRDLMAELNTGSVAPTTTLYHETELAGLPAPVQRYFRGALTDGQPIVTAVSLAQSGTFNMSATGDQ